MPTKLETPTDVAVRLHPHLARDSEKMKATRDTTWHVMAEAAIVEDRKQVIARLKKLAKRARRAADEHDKASAVAMQYDNAESAAEHARKSERLRGKAVAYRTVIKMLREGV